MPDNQNPVYTDNVTILGDGTEEHPLAGASSVGNYSAAEIPAGTVPGFNFTLLHVPKTGTLQLFYNGLLLSAGGIGYTLVGNAITVVTEVEPGDTLVAYYFF
jgi:hypothetical protein